ncbi:MAG: CPBP family intramembrane metalloprotease [Bryobacterales bacterium]|nr:CPBP family intramembrane metalloprotease [Bryobacterales bacterium]
MSVALRVGLFAFLEIVGLVIFAQVMMPVAGLLATAALATFAAAAVANAITLRIWERGRLADIGMNWSGDSVRNLALGFGGGAGAALVVTLLPVAARVSEFRPDPDNPGNWGSFAFLSLVLLFGAVGEEMLFRGYGFQVLVANLGTFATIVPVGILFGLAHSDNQNSGWMGLSNTVLWGVLLGWAFVRSGDLWLPIGLHYGWNVILPLAGVNLSGFKMGITGYKMHWYVGALWSGGEYGPEASLLTTLIVGGLFVYLWRAPIRKQPAFLLRNLEED